MTDAAQLAERYLAGEDMRFADVDAIWEALQRKSAFSTAAAVLERLRRDDSSLLDPPVPASARRRLCQQQALCISKDPEMAASVRHDLALRVLAEQFDLDDPALDGDAETLGIAGGIYKRRWQDLGQLADLRRAATLYQRGAKGPLGEDAYAQINAAFVQDLLAYIGEPSDRVFADRARELRAHIINDLPATSAWFNAASRAEALVGLGRYDEATQALLSGENAPALWKRETTTRQLATLAQIRGDRPDGRPDVEKFFATLLPGGAAAVRSTFIGKVGLALSGGGFRASFYHLGVLARLAELNVLRHVEVLSCVSGGSIVGACYWLALRARLLDEQPIQHRDYVTLVQGLIQHFEEAVASNLRGTVQPSRVRAAFNVLWNGQQGILDPEAVGGELEARFYRPLMRGNGPLYMDQLTFTPADYDPAVTGSQPFNPSAHNWLRAHKVPALVLNATTVNTGHAWQFTATWMGESPWAVHEAADSVRRFQWNWYDPPSGWRIALGRAVAASACVPGVFAPLELGTPYGDEFQVRLVDGGVFDNQGIVALLASSCNVLLVSDAAGQLLLEPKPESGLKGLGAHAMRAMSMLMERVRQANYGDLSARRMSGLLKGLMFLHMKAGLDADLIRLPSSSAAYTLQRATLSKSGVRKDFQQALAELRTDLDDFRVEESRALMACGYQMASKAFDRYLNHLPLADPPISTPWVFDDMRKEIISTALSTPNRTRLLDVLRKGSQSELR